MIFKKQIKTQQDQVVSKQEDCSVGISKQHSKGKLHVTERLKILFDEGYYQELIEPKDRDGVYVCTGLINGKQVIAVAQDFTYMGGSFGLKHGQNILKGQEIAIENGWPFIMINDSGGARIQEGIDSLSVMGNLFSNNVRASGVIPQISMILGPCAGGIAYSSSLMDFTFIVKQVGQMYVTGPKVVKSVLGKNVSAEELGGGYTHSVQSGVAQFFYENENNCLAALRYLIALLPSNSHEGVQIVPKRASNILPVPFIAKVPNDDRVPYEMHDVINSIVDTGSFMEVLPFFATSVLTGFARLNGTTVGIVANNPKIRAGILDCDTSDKAARFVRFCDSFGIPLITLTDVPGYMPGLDQESKGIIRHGAKLLYAFAEATVPKVNIIVRKAFGGAFIAMNSKSLGADKVFAWPDSTVAVMGPEGAVEIIYAKELRKLEGDARTEFLHEMTRKYREEVMSCEIGVEHHYIDEIIPPEQTREIVYRNILSLLKEKKVSEKIRKKHGNIPL